MFEFHSMLENKTMMFKIARLLEIIFKKFGTFDNSIFKRIYIYLVDNYIVYYDNLQNYQDRVEPSLQRKLFYHGNTLVLVSGLIKFLLLTFVEDVSLKVNLGDILHIVISFHRKYFIYINNVLILTILVRLVIFYYEKRLTIKISEILTNNNGCNIFRYNSNEKSLLIIANSAYFSSKVYLIFLYLISILHIISSISAYIVTKKNYNLIALIISTLHNIVLCKIVVMNYAGYTMFGCTTLLFLKLKQNDIIKSIRFNVLWRNKVRLYDNLNDYHQFTRLVDKLSKLINVMCGIIYLFTPFLISQILWELIEEKPKNITENLGQIFFVFVVISLIIIMYIYDDIVSSITKNNQTLPKYLYPIFHDKQFTRFEHRIAFNLNYNFGQLSDIMVRMKIDSFIARLNEEFIGFYCLNLFEVTKLAFFEYIYMLMTVFVLIQEFKVQ